jgi:Hsp20/alpha crystallin family
MEEKLLETSRSFVGCIKPGAAALCSSKHFQTLKRKHVALAVNRKIFFCEFKSRKKVKQREMAFLPVLLDMVDEMYTSLDGQSKRFSDSAPLFFVPQWTGNEQNSGCPQGGPRGCRRFQRGRCQRGACAKPAGDFEVSFDVKTFKPEEINVKVKGHEIHIEAKHEEREDEIGFVSRQFSRRFELPQEFDADTISTSLSAEGKMTIKASKPQPAAVETSERVIPIQRIPTEVLTASTEEKLDETPKPVDESTPQE